VPAKKRANTKSTANLKREIAALRSTLDDVWAALVDIDEANTQEEAVDAVYNACEIMAADWPDDFEITDEFSPNVQEQIVLEGQLIKLAEEGEQTEDWGERVMLFRKALAIQLGVDADYIEQQIGQMPPQDYFQLASGFLWLMGALTAKAPINFRKEADRLLSAIREYKKSLPRKHGPAESPIISEALKIRKKEGKPYRIIFEQLAQKYGAEMMSKYLSPKVLGDRVRSRRSRLRRTKKVSG
jgi:hypothetical protein